MPTADKSVSLSVRFSLEIDDRGQLLEADEGLQTRPPVFSLDDLTGQILLELGESQAVVRDDIGNLAWAFCLDAQPALRAGEPYAVRFYERDGGARWDPAGNDVVLVVDDEPQGRFPRAETADALLRCVQRLARCFFRPLADRHQEPSRPCH